MKTSTAAETRKALSEKLKELCVCGHSRVKHAHAAAFCQGVDEGYVVCLCERFEKRAERTDGG